MWLIFQKISGAKLLIFFGFINNNFQQNYKKKTGTLLRSRNHMRMSEIDYLSLGMSPERSQISSGQLSDLATLEQVAPAGAAFPW